MSDQPLPLPASAPLSLREITTMLSGVVSVINTRLDAIDKATAIFQENLVRVPTDVDKQIFNLRTNVEEMFKRVEQGVDQNDLRYEQRYIASQAALSAAFLAAQSAVTAALASAKDAVQAASIAAEKAVLAQNEATSAAINKTEVSVAKQIDNIMISLTLSAKTLDEKIALINGRLDRGDGVSMNRVSSQHSNTTMITTIVAVAAVGISLMTFLHVGAGGIAATPIVGYSTQATPGK